VTWKQDESYSYEDRVRSASRGGVFLRLHSCTFALCPCTAVCVVCVIYCFTCFRDDDGFSQARWLQTRYSVRAAQVGLLRSLFCNRRVSVAGAICHKFCTCVFFYVSAEDKTGYQVHRGNGILLASASESYIIIISCYRG
jgi:hypothetical protein